MMRPFNNMMPKIIFPRSRRVSPYNKLLFTFGHHCAPVQFSIIINGYIGLHILRSVCSSSRWTKRIDRIVPARHCVKLCIAWWGRINRTGKKWTMHLHNTRFTFCIETGEQERDAALHKTQTLGRSSISLQLHTCLMNMCVWMDIRVFLTLAKFANLKRLAGEREQERDCIIITPQLSLLLRTIAKNRFFPSMCDLILSFAFFPRSPTTCSTH